MAPGLRQLRAQRERVDVLVDQVVQDYHAGFNKSIHNYSQILVLFTQAKEEARPPQAEPLNSSISPSPTPGGLSRPLPRPAASRA